MNPKNAMRPHNESWLNRPKLVIYSDLCSIKKADGTQPAKCCQGASEMHLTLLGHSQCSEGARISAQALGLAWNRSFMEYGYIFDREGCNVHMYKFTYLHLCIECLRLLWMRDLWLVSKYLAMWTSCMMSLHLIVPRNYWCQTTCIILYVYVHLRQFRNKLWPRVAPRLHPLAYVGIGFLPKMWKPCQRNMWLKLEARSPFPLRVR